MLHGLTAPQIQTRPEGALEYNVWYHKWFGGNWQGRDSGV